MKRITVLTLTVLVVALVAVGTHAESTPKAQAWLEKMMGFYDRGTFSVHYTADMNVSQQGQTMTMKMNGEMTQADPKHIRMDLSMDMAIPQNGPVKMQMLTVIDGTTVWIDADNPMMGGRRVMKMSYDQAEKMGGAGGVGNIRNMDPVAQMKEMMDRFDFDLVSDSDGEVVLSAPLDPKALEGMGQLGDMAQGESTEGWKMVVVLDSEKALPKTVRMGKEDDPLMTMTFSDWKFYGEGGAPAGTFEYTPPEGVQVMDLGAMAGGGGTPPGGGQ